MDKQLCNCQQKHLDKHGKPQLCICLALSNLNQAIAREPFYHKTPDIFHKLSQAKMFTIVDSSKGYYHIELVEASSLLTTFNIPFGRFRLTKTPFCLNVAGHALQHKMYTIFNNLDFCIRIADDTVIWGEEVDRSDCDKQLTKVMQVTRQNSLKLNLDKLQFKAKQTSLFGTIFTSDGHKSENDNAQMSNKKTQPTNVRNLCFFAVWSIT